MLSLKRDHKCSWRGVPLNGGADAVFLSCHLLRCVCVARAVKVLGTLVCARAKG